MILGAGLRNSTVPLIFSSCDHQLQLTVTSLQVVCLVLLYVILRDNMMMNDITVLFILWGKLYIRRKRQ